MSNKDLLVYSIYQLCLAQLEDIAAFISNIAASDHYNVLCPVTESHMLWVGLIVKIDDNGGFSTAFQGYHQFSDGRKGMLEMMQQQKLLLQVIVNEKVPASMVAFISLQLHLLLRYCVLGVGNTRIRCCTE